MVRSAGVLAARRAVANASTPPISDTSKTRRSRWTDASVTRAPDMVSNYIYVCIHTEGFPPLKSQPAAGYFGGSFTALIGPAVGGGVNRFPWKLPRAVCTATRPQVHNRPA